MKIAAVILARISSTRLERKVLRDLGGIPLVGHVLKRSFLFPGVDDGAGVVMAIPDGEKDDELVSVGEKFGAMVVRGDEEDVLSRLILAAETVDADAVYRVTADNPLIDPGVVALTWEGFISGDWDYAVMEDTPLGTTAEIVTLDALKAAQKLAQAPGFREHPTLALYKNSDKFRMNLIPPPEKWRHPEWRFTVDREADFQLVKKIIDSLGHDATLEAIVPFLLSHPETASMNSDIAQEGWKDLKERKDAIGQV